MDPDRDPFPGARRRRAWRVALSLSAGLVIAGGLHEAGAYQLYGGHGFVWPASEQPVGYWVANMAHYRMSVEEVATETRAAFAKWESSAQVGISFSYQGLTNQRPFDAFDATNTIGFTTREHMAELGLSPRTLGVTTWLTDAETGRIIESDILVNPSLNWTNDPERAGGWDLRSTLTHEVGHFLGLGHSNVGRIVDGSVLEGSAVMWPFSHGAGKSLGRALTDDDVTGASVLYPGPGAETGVIRGTVVRAGSGEGVRRAHVTVYDPVRGVLVGAWTDESGNFEVGGLADGHYILRVNPIPPDHSTFAYFFLPWLVDQDFSVTVAPSLVPLIGRNAPNVRIEVRP